MSDDKVWVMPCGTMVSREPDGRPEHVDECWKCGELIDA